MRGIVYKASNKFTGESYIGITTNSIKQRQLDHVERALRGEEGKLYQQIATYGPEAFIWEQLDTAANTDELAAKEKQYIITYNTKEAGLNSDAGGGIEKTVYQYDIETKELINSYPNLNSAAIIVNATKQDISRASLSANGLFNGFYWSYDKSDVFIPKGDARKKRVIQLDINHNPIAEYTSVAEASRISGFSKTCISRVCRMEREASNGFYWKYVEEDENEIFNDKI